MYIYIYIYVYVYTYIIYRASVEGSPKKDAMKRARCSAQSRGTVRNTQ